MIDHLTLRVKSYADSKAFYISALAPLGYEVVMEYQGFCGLGVDKKPDLWIAQSESAELGPARHIAFRARSRAEVDAFHAAAIAAGAKDNGKPGPRAQYHPHYYGAFVLDPDGNNIEAVIHTPV